MNWQKNTICSKPSHQIDIRQGIIFLVSLYFLPPGLAADSVNLEPSKVAGSANYSGSSDNLKAILADINLAMTNLDYERCHQLIAYATRRYPNQDMVLLAKANLSFREAKLSESLELVSKLKEPANSQASSLRGELLFSLGRLTEAKQAFEQSLRSGGNQSKTHFLLGQVYFALGNIEGAIVELNQCLLSDPTNLRARVYLINAYDRNESFDEARKQLKLALQSEPENLYLLSKSADLSSRRGLFREAIETLKKALVLEPREPVLSERLTILHGLRNNWNSALDHAQDLEKLSPENAYAALLVAWCAMRTDNPAEAARAFQKAVNLDKQDPHLENCFGLYCLDFGTLQEAERHFLRSIELNKVELAPKMNLVFAKLLAKQWEQAVASLKVLKNVYPDDADLMALNAYALSKNKDWKDAEIASNSALRLDPQNSLALIAAAACQIHKGNTKYGATLLNEAKQNADESPFVLLELAQEQLVAHKTKDSIELIQQAMQIAPHNQYAKALMGLALKANGNLDGAIMLLKEAAVRLPQEPSLRLELAQAQIKKGDQMGAELTYIRALKLNAKDSAALLGLAELKLDCGEFAEARKLADQALDFPETTAAARQVLAQIALKSSHNTHKEEK